MASYFIRQKIKDNIEGAFDTFMAQNKHITRIRMPEEVLVDMCKRGDDFFTVSPFRSYRRFGKYIKNMGYIGVHDCINEKEEGFPIANLWGASIYINNTNKFEVIADNLQSTKRGNYPQAPTVRHIVHSDAIPIPFNIKYYRFSSNMEIIIKSRAVHMQDVSSEENRAIDTLREMITEEEYRRYIKYGFILVRGASGRVYQIFRSNAHTKIWKDGKCVAEVCVRISDRHIPPTDNLIAFKTLIETSENEFIKTGNFYNFQKAA